jgi:hypothetical protein
MSKQKAAGDLSAATRSSEPTRGAAGSRQRERLPTPKELVGMLLRFPGSWWKLAEGEGTPTTLAVCLGCSGEQAVLLQGQTVLPDHRPDLTQVLLPPGTCSGLDFPVVFFLAPYWCSLLRLQALAAHSSLGQLENSWVRELRRRLAAALLEREGPT